MPAFSYEAVDATGASKKGVVNADSARAARSDLRAQGLVPLDEDASQPLATPAISEEDVELFGKLRLAPHSFCDFCHFLRIFSCCSSK